MIKKLMLIICVSVFSFGMGKGPAVVNTAKVTKGEVNVLEEFIGTLSFSKSSDMASQTSGIVKKIYFESGDMVKKGDKLLDIDSDILDAQISSARANLEIAKLNLENSSRDYNRYKKLIEKKSISQKVYDDSYLKYRSALEDLNVAKSKLNELTIEKSKKTIKAPYDGSIVSKNIDLDEWLSVGKTIGTIVNTSEVDLMFNLPTSYVYKLDKQTSYSIKVGSQELKSKLYAAIAKGDRMTRTFPVKFKTNISNIFMYDGMEAKISLPRSKKITSLIVPRDAVIKRFGQNVVFINSDGAANMIPVKIVGYDKNKVAIEAKGLVEGADVVVKGNERIFPKQPIKSLNK